MPITKKDFHDIDHKVITLMGMSGVGKTHMSLMLGGQGWHHYSCDLEIGTTLMGEEIAQTLGEPNKVTADDLSQLSRYVSRLGELPHDEFKRRQEKYYEAECESLRRLKDVVKQAHKDGYQNVLNDSTGSLCEIDDDTLLDSVDENSLIIYIKANAEEEKAVLQRAQDYPKPMFFSPERFDYWVSEYSAENGDIAPDDFNADAFGRWVFPRLFENRLPKYQRIADKYGATIPSEEFHAVTTSDEFLDVIVSHLPDTYR
jgi:dephospho-CoA kinase